MKIVLNKRAHSSMWQVAYAASLGGSVAGRYRFLNSIGLRFSQPYMSYEYEIIEEEKWMIFQLTYL